MTWIARLPLVRVLQAAFAIAIGLLFAQVIWHASGRVALQDAPKARAASASLPETRSTDVSAFLELALFGLSSSGTLSAPDNELPLDLVLLAVRVAEPANLSTATLSVSNAPAAIFRQGDVVGGFAKLERVEPRGVLLDINGRSRMLTFPDQSASPELRGIYAEKVAEYGAQPVAAAPAQAQDSDQVVDEIRSEIAADPQRLLDRYSLSRTDEGYEIGSAPPEVLLRAGVKPGDRVLRVNGQPVGEFEQDRLLFETVVASGRARVEVLRDGRRLTLTFPLK